MIYNANRHPFAVVVGALLADNQLAQSIQPAWPNGKRSARKRSTQRNTAIAVQSPCRENIFIVCD